MINTTSRLQVHIRCLIFLKIDYRKSKELFSVHSKVRTVNRIELPMWNSNMELPWIQQIPFFSCNWMSFTFTKFIFIFIITCCHVEDSLCCLSIIYAIMYRIWQELFCWVALVFVRSRCSFWKSNFE